MQQSPVYIIDDSKIQVIILEKILLEEGFPVQAFGNGHDLIRELENENNPLLIISDVDMPGMNGFELIEAVKQKSCCRDIPFFFISSNGNADVVEKARKMGAKDFIEKPFKSKLLIEMVRKAIVN